MKREDPVEIGARDTANASESDGNSSTNGDKKEIFSPDLGPVDYYPTTERDMGLGVIDKKVRNHHATLARRHAIAQQAAMLNIM